MSEHGIQDGDEVCCVIYKNKVAVGEVVVVALNENEVSASVTLERPEDIFTVYETLRASLESCKYHIHRPILRRLLKDRIAELKEADREGREDYSPSPADDNGG